NENIQLLQKQLSQVTCEKNDLLEKVKELNQLEQQLNEELLLDEKRLEVLQMNSKEENLSLTDAPQSTEHIGSADKQKFISEIKKQSTEICNVLPTSET